MKMNLNGLAVKIELEMYQGNRKLLKKADAPKLKSDKRHKLNEN